MTVTNRRVPRPTKSNPSSTPQFNAQTQSSSSSNTDISNNSDDNNQYNTPIYAPLPKHVGFPVIPNSSEILNELILFAFTLLAGGTQFMHLYRTVWWFPDSYVNTTLNLFLIDKYLVIFIVTMVGRRVLYCSLIKIVEITCPPKYKNIIKNITKYVFVAVLSGIFIQCGIHIFQSHSYLHLFCLSYPVFLYFCIFRFNIEPFLRIINENDTSYYLNGIPMHSCTSNSSDVRDEVEILRKDFNYRFKQIIFTSVLNAYYTGFIPCCFVYKHLYYDSFWATQHLLFIWIGAFTMITTTCFPLKYSNILHRSALHLGQWNRVNHRSQPASLIVWSKLSIYPYGTYVKYLGDAFKSVGFCTAAIPGNNSHQRFYILFKNPINFYKILSCLQLIIILTQLVVLSMTTEWQKLLSLSFLILTNHFTLFRLCRDYLVSKDIYSSEINLKDVKNN